MRKKGDAPVVQLLVQWSTQTLEAATWEDYDVLRARYLAAAIWEEASSQGAATVTPAAPSV